MRYIFAIAMHGVPSRCIYISTTRSYCGSIPWQIALNETVEEWNIRISYYRHLRFYLIRCITARNIEIINSCVEQRAINFTLLHRRDGKWHAANSCLIIILTNHTFRKSIKYHQQINSSSNTRSGCTRCCIWMKNNSRLCTPGQIFEDYWIMCRVVRSRRSRRCAARGWILIFIVRKQEVICMRNCGKITKWFANDFQQF